MNVFPQIGVHIFWCFVSMRQLDPCGGFDFYNEFPQVPSLFNLFSMNIFFPLWTWPRYASNKDSNTRLCIFSGGLHRDAAGPGVPHMDWWSKTKCHMFVSSGARVELHTCPGLSNRIWNNKWWEKCVSDVSSTVLMFLRFLEVFPVQNFTSADDSPNRVNFIMKPPEPPCYFALSRWMVFRSRSPCTPSSMR